MANKFCDSLLTTGNNDGTTMDDAYQSIKTAMEAALSTGDKLYVRRRSGFWNPTSHIAPTADGLLVTPISAIGCPRNVKTGIGTFTQGSNVISGASFLPKLEQHGTRIIKNDADGREYMVSAIAHKINYDNKSGDFTEGLMVTGAGGCEGKIHRVVDNGDGTGTLWIVSKATELLDRGNCEDVIAPMIFHEFTPVISLGTYERSTGQVYEGDYSWKITKTVGVGGGQTSVYLQDNTGIDLHGFKAGKNYRMSFRCYCDEITNPHGVQIYEYHDAGWNFKGNFLFTSALAWENLIINHTMNAGSTGIWLRFFISSNAALNSYIHVDKLSIKNAFLDDEEITDEDTGVADVNGVLIDDGFIILNNYAGATNTGALTIEKDEDYDDFQLIDDSAWTIKKVDWNADVDDLPIVDFGNKPYDLYMTTCYQWVVKNMKFMGSLFTYGTVYLVSLYNSLFKNCIVQQTNDKCCFYIYNGYDRLHRCLIIGNVGGTAQYGILTTTNAFVIYLEDCAIYNMGYSAIRGKQYDFSNVNMGVELPNSYQDIWTAGGIKRCKDLNLGGKNGDILKYGTLAGNIFMENSQKVLNDHKIEYYNGAMLKKDVIVGSGDPYKRSNGADSVIEISCGRTDNVGPSMPDKWKYLIFEHEFEMDAGLRNYRYYVQCKLMAINSVGELFLECEYVDQYVSDSVYHMKKIRSDEIISQRSGADDWSKYLEVIGIQPAVTSKVRIKCYVAKYDVNGRIFIDSKVVIT